MLGFVFKQECHTFFLIQLSTSLKQVWISSSLSCTHTSVPEGILSGYYVDLKTTAEELSSM